MNQRISITNRATLTLSLFVAVLFIAALFTRCASVGSPSGGPKDTLAPVIVAMTPDNFMTNADRNLKKIYIEFDEFVQIKDQQKLFFTSPAMKNRPQLQIRGRGVVVTLRDTLLENTTYALNFGNSIQDNNESNPLFSMRYVFSTGDEIDSMIMSGYTEDGYKADSVSNTFILLYPTDSLNRRIDYDSTIFTSTPAVIARAETNGIFLAQNIKPISYHIYAYEDKNSNLQYDPGEDKVGFMNSPANPLTLDEFAIWYDSLRRYIVAEPQLHLRMFQDVAFKRQLLASSERKEQRKIDLYFGAPNPRIDSIVFDSIPSDSIIVERITKGADTLALWINMKAENIPDTIKGYIVYERHDSLNILNPARENLRLMWKYIESKEEAQRKKQEEREREKAEESGEEWTPPEVASKLIVKASNSEKVNPKERLTFNFDLPLRRFDGDSIIFKRLTKEDIMLQEKITEELKKRASEAREMTAIKAKMEGANEAEIKRLSDKADSTIMAEYRPYNGENHPFKIAQDTMNLRRWYIDCDWGKEGDVFNLTIPAGAVEDISGEINDKEFSGKYTPLKVEDFATVILNFTNAKYSKRRYVVELLDNTGNKVLDKRTEIDNHTVIFNYVPAGSVRVRVIEDMNHNGVWDSGNLIKRMQPEQIKMVEHEGGTDIATKVNWEIEIDVDLATLFAAETKEQLSKRLADQESQRLKNLKTNK